MLLPLSSKELGKSEAAGSGGVRRVTSWHQPNLGTRPCVWCPEPWAGRLRTTEGQNEGQQERLCFASEDRKNVTKTLSSLKITRAGVVNVSQRSGLEPRSV